MLISGTELKEELRLIENLQRRWMVGSGDNLEPEQIPQSWRSLLQEHSADRTALLSLALASQQQLMLLQTSEATIKTLKTKPCLPLLKHPALASHLRPAFRRTLDAIKKNGGVTISHLLQLLLQRQVVAHPADWLPSAKDHELPSVYWPWCRWAANELNHETTHDEELLEDTWDSFFPAERLALLRKMRLHNADAARELIMQCAGREPADKRFKIIETLAVNLAEGDAQYLQSLSEDRSQKIARLATQFLLRLDIHSVNSEITEATQEQAKDLAETYEINKGGLLKKKLKLEPRKLKSKKQQAVRSELLEKVSLNEFAEALGLRLEQLVTAWRFESNRNHDNQLFLANAVSCLADEHMSSLLDNLLASVHNDKSILGLVQLLLPRLEESRRTAIMLHLFNNKAAKLDFSDCLSFIDAPLAEMDFNELSQSYAWQNLVESIRKDLKDGGYLDDYYTCRELVALGLFVPRHIAETLLDTVVEQGMLRADPALDTLKLNSQLSKQ